MPAIGCSRTAALDQRRQIQLEPMLEHDAQHADGGAPQTERVARAAGLLTDGEDAGQRIELVGERHGIADAGGRQRIAGAARQVVLARSLRRPRRLSPSASA